MTCWKEEEEYNNKWSVSGFEIAEIYCKGRDFRQLATAGQRKM